MDTRWKALGPVYQNREYTALLSYLPLRSYLRIPLFFRFTCHVQRQLLVSPGAVGYSAREAVEPEILDAFRVGK